MNSFILWDEFSVEKSVIWVVFGKQMFIIRNAIASVAVSNGSQICLVITLSHYALIANPIISKKSKNIRASSVFGQIYGQES